MITDIFLLIGYSKDEKTGVSPQPVPVFGFLYWVNLKKEMSNVKIVVLRSTASSRLPSRSQGNWPRSCAAEVAAGSGGKCLAPPAEQGWAGRGQLALSSSPEAPWCSLAWRAASQHPSTCPSDKTFVWSKAFQLLSAPHHTFSYFFLSGPLGVGMSEVRVQELRLVGGLSPTLRAPGGSLRGRPWGVRASPRNRSTSE